jgi:predicted RNase H-like HicB family nuclease
MRYIYEVVLEPDAEDSEFYNVSVPDLDGCFTCGKGMDEAVAMAADAMMTFIAALVKFGDPVPDSTFGHKAPKGGKVMAVSFETDASYIVDTVAPSVAAEMLGVTRGRVSQMVRAGALEAIKDEAGTRILRSSVETRLSEPRSAGRPKMAIA